MDGHTDRQADSSTHVPPKTFCLWGYKYNMAKIIKFESE